MSTKNLKAVVIGAGWAGEGHTRALQQQGIEVAAICARQTEVVQKVAAGLGVAQASADWRQTLLDLRPDIVTLATPAGLRGEVVEVAGQLGCHILCEKPLAATAEEAQRLYQLVEGVGVKHAYAATHRYDPAVLWTAELIALGAIGRLRTIDLIFSAPRFNPLLPWSWADVVAQGGGTLNLMLTHILGMLERITNQPLRAAVGQASVPRDKAPVLPDIIHDFRQLRTAPRLTAEAAAKLAWRPCDAERSFSALLQFGPAEVETAETAAPIIAFVRLDGEAAVPGPSNGWYFHGDQGLLLGEGLISFTLSQQRAEVREPLPTPQRLVEALPPLEDDEQRKWAALVRDFVADIRGEEHDPYLTFRDGWRYQVAIDAIRQGRGWSPIPEA